MAVKLSDDVQLDAPPSSAAQKLPDNIPLDAPAGPSFTSQRERSGSGIPHPVTDVLPAVVNFADAPARAIAADLYATVDAAKQQFTGGAPSLDRWWDRVGKSMQATAIPESAVGQRISDVLNLPGEIIGGVVRGASNLFLGPERTKQLGPAAKVAADVATPLLMGKAIGREGTPSATPTTPFTVAQKTFQDVDLKAADVVAKRIGQDVKYGGLTATQAMQKLAEGRDAGKPLTIADVGDENVRALGGYVARQPGARSLAHGFLEAREKAASERLAQDIGTYIFSGLSMLKTTDELLKTRSAAARPLYEQAETLQGVWSPRLQEFISEPDVRKGLARGYRLERLDALAEGRKFDPTALGVDLDFEGNIVMKKVPNLRVLDMGKRGLDALIADERDPLTGRLSALGMELNKVRGAYVSEIDGLDASGTYKAAREAWAGPSQSLDAMRWGRTIFNRSPEETARDFAKLPPNNQEFVRLGVADVLRERVAKTGFSGNEARAIIKNSWTRDQLRPIFRTDQEFDKFADAVMAEHTMAGTAAKMIRGSQTAERVVEDKSGLTPEVATSAVQMASHVINGNFPMALVHGWRIQRRLRKDVGDDPALNEAVAKIIFNPSIKLEDPRVQRMITGPPKAEGPGTARRAIGAVGAYAPAVAAMGLENSSTPPY